MKKIPTLFVRDFTRDNGRYVTEEVTPGCEWVLAGEGVATRKYDGTCVLVDDERHIWTRREVKIGKANPPGFQPIETDGITGKTVGWEPAEQSGFSKFIDEATEAQPDLLPGTYELIGPKINGNPEDYQAHRLVRHGDFLLDVPKLTFAGIRGLLAAVNEQMNVEGIVWHHPDGRMVKIKTRDFRAGGTPE